MRFIKLIAFFALAGLCFAVDAAEVSQADAGLAAKGWLRRNASRAGRRGNRGIRIAASHSTTNGAVFHSFRMNGGGTIITSGDTEATPVIAFMSGDVDLEALPENHPLKALLNLDLSRRQSPVVQSSGQRLSNGKGPISNRTPLMTAAAAAAPTAEPEGENASLWEELIAEGGRSPGLLMAAEGEEEGPIVPSDLRVDALVQSKWSQSGHGENWYTPSMTNADNYANIPGDSRNVVCGCVATAMSQIMRYHCWPTNEVESISKQCKCFGYNFTLNTQGGIYDWANMPLTFGGGMTVEQKEAIGKLTSDAGISVGMMYAEGGKNSSGAYSKDVPDALTKVWGYGSAVHYRNDDSGARLSRAEMMCRLFFANFDAGYPVQLGISSAVGGHAIVSDGYGYEGTTDYVHLNFGWGGSSDDAWYNLPDFGETGYTSLNDIIYNIFPLPQGGSGIVSGRVFDGADQPVGNALVQVLQEGVEVAVVTSNVSGVWGAVVPIISDWTDVIVKATAADGSTCESDLIAVPSPIADSVGNFWGVELKVAAPNVRIVEADGAVTNFYSTLEQALAAAKAFSVNGVIPVVELLTDVSVAKGQVLTGDFNYTLTSASPAVYTVSCGTNAYFSVSAACSNRFEQVRIVAEDGSAAVRVEAGGTAVFGDELELAKTVSDDVSGLFFEAVPSNLCVMCSAAREYDSVFGYAVPGLSGLDTLRNGYEKIADEFLGAEGETVGGSVLLVWKLVPVTPEDAAVVAVDDDGNTNSYKSLDHALEEFKGGELTVRGTNDLSKSVEVTSDTTIRGEGGAVVNVADRKASEQETGFTVTSGRLAVKGVTFEGPVGGQTEGNNRVDGLFTVNGEGAELELGEGVVLHRLIAISRGQIAGVKTSGAVNVLRGKAKLTGGAVIDGCGCIQDPQDPKRGFGGAVYLYGEGCELLLDGCTIEKCFAQTYGGGVYVGSGAKLALQGKSKVQRNYRLDDDRSTPDDNIYLEGHAFGLGNFTLTGKLEEKVGVSWGQGGNTGNAISNNFITVDAAVSESAAVNSLAYFSCDVDSSLYAAVGDSGTNLSWSNTVPPEPPQSETVHPVSFWFAAIERNAEGTLCTLTLTNLVKFCNYTVYSTNDLTGVVNFPTNGVTPVVTNFQAEADGALEFTVPVVPTESAFFSATGADGEAN